MEKTQILVAHHKERIDRTKKGWLAAKKSTEVKKNIRLEIMYNFLHAFLFIVDNNKLQYHNFIKIIGYSQVYSAGRIILTAEITG